MVAADAPIHPSVWDRLNGPEVLIYDEVKRYSPENLKQHAQYGLAHLDDGPTPETHRSRDVTELCCSDRRRDNGGSIEATLEEAGVP
jgi:hypothetical protein